MTQVPSLRAEWLPDDMYPWPLLFPKRRYDEPLASAASHWLADQSSARSGTESRPSAAVVFQDPNALRGACMFTLPTGRAIPPETVGWRYLRVPLLHMRREVYVAGDDGSRCAVLATAIFAHRDTIYTRAKATILTGSQIIADYLPLPRPISLDRPFPGPLIHSFPLSLFSFLPYHRRVARCVS